MNDTDSTPATDTDPPAPASVPPAGSGTGATTEPVPDGPSGHVPELARHADPSRPHIADKKTVSGGAVQRVGRGVVWVRASELMGMAGARVTGRGIDFHAELVRRARGPAVQAVAASRRVVGERVRRLPPVTAFGRRDRPTPGATGSGIGAR